MKKRKEIARATYKHYPLNRAEVLETVRDAESMILEHAGKYDDGIEFYVIRVNVKRKETI